MQELLVDKAVLATHKHHGQPAKPMGVTIPLPIWVRCLQVQVQVRVDKKKPGVTHVMPYRWNNMHQWKWARSFYCYLREAMVFAIDADLWQWGDF